MQTVPSPRRTRYKIRTYIVAANAIIAKLDKVDRIGDD
jgi:hypothetical protein